VSEKETQESIESFFRTLGLASQEERAKYRNLVDAEAMIRSSWGVWTASNAAADDVCRDDHDDTGRGHA